MKHYLLYIFAATLLVSCSKGGEEVPGGEMSESKVHFAADIPVKEDDWNRTTRGAVTNNANIRNFGAFCFHTDHNKWNDVSTTATPNKMYNIEVLRTPSTNDWVYNPPVEWEGGDGSYFSFFGYSPRATGIYQEQDNPQGNNLEITSTASTPNVPTLSYTTMTDVAQQADLLVAKPVIDTRPVEKVHMQFSHSLSQIRFKGWSAQQGTTPLSIAIKGIQYKGAVAIDGGAIAWNKKTDVTNFILENNFPVVSTDEQNMTDLSSGDRAFMLLPQDLTHNTMANIEITARLGGTEKATTYIIKENWETGKSYTYTINLGGKSTEEIIVTGVTVTDWIVVSEEDMNTGNN